MKKLLFLLATLVVMCLISGTAFADVSVSWVSPADGSTYAVGTDVFPTGQASATGTTGGTGLDLALVIDTSGSMAGSGIAAAKAAAIALVNALPQTTTSVSVIRFSSSASTVQTLTPLTPTTNKDAIIAAINSLGVGGGTSIGTGIVQAHNELGTYVLGGQIKTMVVLSDGSSYSGYVAAAEAAYADGITVHAVGVPGHNVSQMQSIATAGGGVYTSGSLDQLVAIFNGTGGNLVGIDYVNIELPDGTFINNIAIDGLGNFILPAWMMELGTNTFTATAYDNDGNFATAVLTLNGQGGDVPVPEPSTFLLLGGGLAGLAFYRRKKSVK